LVAKSHIQPQSTTLKTVTQPAQRWGVQFHPESAGGPLDTMKVIILFSFPDNLASDMRDVEVYRLRYWVPSGKAQSKKLQKHHKHERDTTKEASRQGAGTDCDCGLDLVLML
jgi:hypothetical protein